MISLKLAQTDKVKSTLYEVEKMIKMNLESLSLEQLGELVIVYSQNNETAASHLQTK